MMDTEDGRVPAAPGCESTASAAQEGVFAKSHPSREDRPWPLGGYAPGNYTCTCVKCTSRFDGDKRALVCLECAAVDTKFWITDLRATAAAWREWFAQRRAALDELIRAAAVFWGSGSEQHNLVRDVADAVLKSPPGEWDIAKDAEEAAPSEQSR